MPLYEYTCQKCHTLSELLIKGSEDPVCPQCGSTAMKKEFSTFSTNAEGGKASAAPHPSGCGCCMGPQGSCGLN